MPVGGRSAAYNVAAPLRTTVASGSNGTSLRRHLPCRNGWEAELLRYGTPARTPSAHSRRGKVDVACMPPSGVPVVSGTFSTGPCIQHGFADTLPTETRSDERSRGACQSSSPRSTGTTGASLRDLVDRRQGCPPNVSVSQCTPSTPRDLADPCCERAPHPD